MWLITRTQIGFEVPSEYLMMQKFETEHPEFCKNETSSVVWYTLEKTFRSKMEQEDE